jgi:hypothetical protein
VDADGHLLGIADPADLATAIRAAGAEAATAAAAHAGGA